jgi:hypothetical protein
VLGPSNDDKLVRRRRSTAGRVSMALASLSSLLPPAAAYICCWRAVSTALVADRRPGPARRTANANANANFGLARARAGRAPPPSREFKRIRTPAASRGRGRRRCHCFCCCCCCSCCCRCCCCCWPTPPSERNAPLANTGFLVTRVGRLAAAGSSGALRSTRRPAGSVVRRSPFAVRRSLSRVSGQTDLGGQQAWACSRPLIKRD